MPSHIHPTVLRRTAVGVAAACAGAVLAACSGSGGGATSSSVASGGSGSPTSAAAPKAAVGTVTITSAKGCELDRTSFDAGGLTFKITNKDATAVSEVELLSGERIIGEKENVPAGLGGEFAVKVGAGKYTLYCPGANSERSTVTVTGKLAETDTTLAGLIKQGTVDYKTYVDTQVGYLVDATNKLNDALDGSNLKTAQDAYIAARPYYEKIEPVAESFVNGKQNLDADIDARANDVPASQWGGYHRIEKGLFQDKSLTGLQKVGTALVKNVGILQAKTRQLTYGAPDLANGAVGLLDEVASPTGKLSGEEERYSHIDIVDMANNVEGSEQAFADLQPALKKIDATLAATISTRFAALNDMVDKYRTQSNPSGYVLYSTLNDSDRKRLAAAVKAVSEPLSRVAAKVANA